MDRLIPQRQRSRRIRSCGRNRLAPITKDRNNGSVDLRHNNKANAFFFDGHVGNFDQGKLVSNDRIIHDGN
ncbi:MAG: hypothetical protein IKD44_00700 [Lentisphaeria bacterium]|nr:hypothetical protein [Lentisphaeria bacterium]